MTVYMNVIVSWQDESTEAAIASIKTWSLHEGAYVQVRIDAESWVVGADGVVTPPVPGEVPPPEVPPAASATFTHTPDVPQRNDEVTFDATGSVGQEYVWDFGDAQFGNGLTVTHQYTRRGAYTVTLTVRGASGDEVTATEVVTVE